jgi:SWIM/SEC-C metal-binding protein
MATIGTRANPARASVQTEERAFELLGFCQDRRIQLIVELAPDEPEDIADIECALLERIPVVAPPKIGRNETCPCGSGKKFKKCCEGQLAPTAS